MRFWREGAVWTPEIDDFRPWILKVRSEGPLGVAEPLIGPLLRDQYACSGIGGHLLLKTQVTWWPSEYFVSGRTSTPASLMARGHPWTGFGPALARRLVRRAFALASLPKPGTNRLMAINGVAGKGVLVPPPSLGQEVGPPLGEPLRPPDGKSHPESG